MARSAAPLQSHLEGAVLRCLNEHSPRSIADVQDYVSRHVDLSADERVLVCHPSGKEIRRYEQTVANLLTPGRKGNLTARDLVRRPERDAYFITELGQLDVQRSIELEKHLDGLGFDFSE